MEDKIKYVVASVILIGFVLVGFSLKGEAKEISVSEKTEISAQEASENNDSNIKVYVKGQVKNPGVYELEVDSRVKDAIDKAGGITQAGSLEYINLSKKVFDEMLIKVYSKDEIKNSNKVEVVTEYIEVPVECSCPLNDACLNDLEPDKVNLNKASLDELMNLPGIGEQKALDIIEYRQNKPFENIEDIKNISGIGESTFEKLKDYIKV